MRIPPLYPRITPIPPLFLDPPPPPEKKPDEPVSFCGHLSRLMEIHRRHLLFDRMMNLWIRMTSFLRPVPVENHNHFNRLV